MLKYYQLIQIEKDGDYAFYVTNNPSYKGKIRILLDKVSNFENAVRAERVGIDQWLERLV